MWSTELRSPDLTVVEVLQHSHRGVQRRLDSGHGLLSTVRGYRGPNVWPPSLWKGRSSAWQNCGPASMALPSSGPCLGLCLPGGRNLTFSTARAPPARWHLSCHLHKGSEQRGVSNRGYSTPQSQGSRSPQTLKTKAVTPVTTSLLVPQAGP